MESRIELLPEHIIDQIKAGEVVEKPANVIKELIENSIDAGSTEIKVTIKNNGLDLIAIEDNGHGMSFDDLPYAFCRHATSKIKKFDDIYKLSTFGFRGEALASISSIARVSCHSAPNTNLETGGKFVIHGAQTVEHAHYKPSQSGTTLYIKDLFFNTPARLKFVRSKISERNSLKRIINSFVIMNPQVRFVINFNEDEKEIFNPIHDYTLKRVEQVFFSNKKNIDRAILSSRREYMGTKVICNVSRRSTKGNSGKQQYLFVNNRLFADKKVHQIVIRNLEPIWGYGQSGNYHIDIKVPENEIDVNVHPNKILVKFLKESEVFSVVSASLKDIVEENNKEYLGQSSTEEIEFEDNDQPHSTESILEKLGRLNHQTEQNESSFGNTYQNSSFGQSNLFKSKADLQIENLAGMIYLIKDNSVTEKRYFLNMNVVLEDILKKLQTKEHIQTLPLLISEPFKIEKITNEAELLLELNKMGLEIERLDEHTLVLRSIPEIFEEIDYTNLTKTIIDHFIVNNDLTGISFSNLKFDQRFVFEQINTYGLSGLLELHSLKSFKEKDLLKIFYAKK